MSSMLEQSPDRAKAKALWTVELLLMGKRLESRAALSPYISDSSRIASIICETFPPSQIAIVKSPEKRKEIFNTYAYLYLA
jgi:hypothetical protein